MRHLGKPALLVLLASCGGASGGGFTANVSYHLQKKADGCVKLRVSPSKPTGLSAENSVALTTRPADGTVKFGIAAGQDWQGEVTLTATLHLPCGAPAIDSDVKKEALPTGGRVVTLAFDLTEPALDGGTDAGTDGGTDGGTDAGAGVDAGIDGGVSDAGEDAGTDAGDPDGGGSDAGADGGTPDAGPLTCDGGLSTFPTPTGLTTWHDFAPYPGGVWLAGSGALFFRSGAGWASASIDCFAGNHRAAWARADGRVYVGTTNQPLKYADPDGGACQPLTTQPGIGDALGIVGFVDAGTTFVYSVTETGTIVRNTDPEVTALNRRWDFSDAGVQTFWTVGGADEAALFAAGQIGSNGSGVIYRYSPATETWTKLTTSINAPVNELSMLGPQLGYAGTQGADLFEWDGVDWTRVSNNMFGAPIYGIQAFAKDEVVGVGANATARRWNGTTWSTLGAFDAGPGGYLSRVRAVNRCDVWAGGSNGLLVHSAP